MRLKRRRKARIVLAVALLSCAGAALAYSQRHAKAKTYGYEIVNTFPHDRAAYCQGLVFDEGVLYESTGQYGKSSVRTVELETGNVLKQQQLKSSLFGEGIVVWEQDLIQLSWRSQAAFIYDKKTLKYRSYFRYAGEGWGLTHDGKHLIQSDGTSTLRFLNPRTHRVTRRLKVRDGRRPIEHLNELEYVGGEIYANVWHSDSIARIDPENGRVTGWIDLSGLFPPSQRRDRESVLNGIAYDKQKKRLFVTGKNWPNLFEIRVVEQ